jgi:microcystin-dependent protein
MLDWPTTSSYPTGYLRADGTAVSRTSYADLFSLIGTTYGIGDNVSTFNLPNLVAAGSGSPVKIIKASLGGIVEPSTVAHAASHTQGGSDVITVTGNQIDNYQTYRNAIINGNMNVWQRSTSSTTLGYATADRWWVNNGGGTTTIARESTIIPSRFQYAMKWTQATTANVVGIQSIESINCTHLAGQTVTVSGYFAASASTSFTIDLLSSTSVDVAPASFSTSITPTSGGSGTVSSTTYVRVSGVYVVPSNVKSLAVRINATSLTNGTSFYFTGIQLEVGTTVTPYEFEPFETTLRKCQRYFTRMSYSTGAVIATGMCRASNVVYWPMVLPVYMRTIPGISNALGTWAVVDAGGTGRGLSSFGYQTSGNNLAGMYATGFSLVAGNAATIFASTDVTFDASSEL